MELEDTQKSLEATKKNIEDSKKEIDSCDKQANELRQKRDDVSVGFLLIYLSLITQFSPIELTVIILLYQIYYCCIYVFSANLQFLHI